MVALTHTGSEPPAFTGFGEELTTMFTFLDTRVARLVVKEELPPAEVAEFLRQPAADPAVVIERLRRRGDQVFAFSVAYLPGAWASHLTYDDLHEQTPLPELLENRLNIPLAEALLSVTAVPADAVLAGHLEVTPNIPLLQYEVRYLAQDGTPLILARIHFRGDAHQHRMRLAWMNASPGARRGRPSTQCPRL